MTDYDRAALRAELSRDEGRRSKPYRCTAGYLTIGVGHNLDANGLPEKVIDELLDLGIETAEATLDIWLPTWRELDDDRQRVLLNMAFNLGAQRLAAFKRLKGALVGYLETRNPSWLEQAADEMRDSAWAKQVGARAERLIAVMRP